MPAKRPTPARKPAKKAPTNKKVPASKKSPAKTKAAATPPANDPAAVKAWIAAQLPERRRLLRTIDGVLRDAIPDVVRTTKYRKPSDPLGTPFYGRPGTGWIAMLHSLKNEIRVTFFAGASLHPPPPIAANAGTRRVDITSREDLDEDQLRAWAKQGAKLPGWGRI